MEKLRIVLFSGLNELGRVIITWGVFHGDHLPHYYLWLPWFHLLGSSNTEASISLRESKGEIESFIMIHLWMVLQLLSTIFITFLCFH